MITSIEKEAKRDIRKAYSTHRQGKKKEVQHKFKQGRVYNN